MKRHRKKRKPSLPLALLKGGLFLLLLGAFTSLIYLTQKPPTPSPKPSSSGKHSSFPKAPQVPKVNISPTPPAEVPQAPPLKSRSRGKIAIVIDDVGYDLSLLKQFLQIDVPLTFSVLPGLPYSTASANLIRREGKTLILHMPMQPEREVPMDNSFITVDLSPSQVEERIEKALESVPGAIGMSNHMGSLVTENEAIMEVVMTTLAKHKLFFLDSLTSPHSVGIKCALKAGVPALERDVFLDNEENPQYILGQFDQLIRLALKKGKAVGIGHLRETTLEGIKLALLQLKGGDIEVVPLNELLR